VAIRRTTAAARLGAAVLVVIAAALSGCDRPSARPAASKPYPPPVAGSSEVRASFTPSTHGFVFRNHFPGVGLPTALVGTGSNAADANAFGLCGGMSAAAADFFFAGRPVPSLDVPPARGTPLYEYLYLRQAESIGPGIAGALRFVEWMRLSDDELRAQTRGQLTAIRAAIESRGVAPIGLVLARFGGPPGARAAADNHQVLALRVVDGPTHPTIEIYDPNFPGDDSVRIDLDGLSSSPGVVGHRVRKLGKPTPVRGVMLMPYEPRTPP
jgi:hypothetical protein